MPERVKQRPQYRGLPIPFINIVGDDGVPNFKANDIVCWHICLDEHKCGICGEHLDYWCWYLGGEGHMRQEEFFDPPMHEDCARYAASICPYIAKGKAYGDHIKPVSGAEYIIELAPREAMSDEGVPMFIARGRRDNVRKRSDRFTDTFMKSGTLHDIEPIGKYSEVSK